MRNTTLAACSTVGEGDRSADIAKAAKWIQEAADQGLPQAQSYLGWMYHLGQGVSKDDMEALKWFRRAAEQDLDEEQTIFAYIPLYQNDHNAVASAKWFRKANEQGADWAQNNLFDLARHFPKHHPYAVNDISRMYYKLGVKAENEEGKNEAKKNDKEAELWRYAALEWYRNAGWYAKTQGNLTRIHYKLGEMLYSEGKHDGAAMWYQAAGRGGHVDAQFKLGLMYAKGEGMLRANYVKAVEWYRKAAEQGHAEAQNNLGKIYEKGADGAKATVSKQGSIGIAKAKECQKDEVEAVKWYRKAAEQGFAPAQNNLGYMYDHGRGVSEDDAEAVKWYRKAAFQGNATAQYNLAEKYRTGKGVDKDGNEAFNWYRNAALQGHAKAESRLQKYYPLLNWR